MEIFSGQVPFFECTLEITVVLKVTTGERPSRPSVCEPRKQNCESVGLSDEIWNMVDKCWSANPDDRPSASDVVQLLSPMVLQPPVHEFDTLSSSHGTELPSWHHFLDQH